MSHSPIDINFIKAMLISLAEQLSMVIMLVTGFLIARFSILKKKGLLSADMEIILQKFYGK